MFFLKKLVSWFIMPTHLVICLFVLGWILQRYSPYKKIGRGLKIVSFALFIVFGCGFGARTYLHNIEHKYPSFDPTPEQSEILQGAIIVVLGQWMAKDSGRPLYYRNNATFERRLFEGVRVAKLIPNSHILVSMAGDAETSTKQAFLNWYMEQFHFPIDRVSMVTTARDTREEAQLTVEAFRENSILKEKESDVFTEVNVVFTNDTLSTILFPLAPTNAMPRLVVVTTASHIPRAIKIFHKTGIDAIPAPCDYSHFEKGRRVRYFLQFISGENFAMTERAAHEWFGSIYERMFAFP